MGASTNLSQRQAAAPRRWGAWATLAWSVLVVVVFLAVQGLFFVVYLDYVSDAALDVAEQTTALQYDGDVIALATLLTTFVCVPLILVIVKLKRGAHLSEYLPLTLPSSRVLRFWLVVLLIFIAASDLLSWLTGHPIVPDFMKQAYTTADSKLLLWIGIGLAAPLFEETLFRGFMLTGLSPSRLGAGGAIVLTSLVWAVVHVQYDWYGIATIFAVGILLGIARMRTGSLATPLLLHAAGNTFAFLQTVVLVGSGRV